MYSSTSSVGAIDSPQRSRTAPDKPEPNPNADGYEDNGSSSPVYSSTSSVRAVDSFQQSGMTSDDTDSDSDREGGVALG